MCYFRFHVRDLRYVQCVQLLVDGACDIALPEQYNRIVCLKTTHVFVHFRVSEHVALNELSLDCHLS